MLFRSDACMDHVWSIQTEGSQNQQVDLGNLWVQSLTPNRKNAVKISWRCPVFDAILMYPPVSSYLIKYIKQNNISPMDPVGR